MWQLGIQAEQIAIKSLQDLKAPEKIKYKYNAELQRADPGTKVVG